MTIKNIMHSLLGLCLCITTTHVHAQDDTQTSLIQKLKPSLVAGSVEQGTVTTLDLPSYLGTWYEVGRLPMPFQEQCASNVSANYTLNKDGTIKVTNTCTTPKGETSIAVGKAWTTSEASKLKVSFAPWYVYMFGIAKANYWVYALDKDYQYALVGTGDKRYLWLLSRKPVMDAQTQKAYLAIAQSEGFNTDTWIQTIPLTQ